MRALFAVAIAIGAAACGDGSSQRLVSADVTGGSAESCVVSDPRDPRDPRDARAPAMWTARATGTWTVRQGDSLRRIARKVYGDENLWKAIRDANPGKIGREGVILPGTELVVPRDGI